MKAQFILIACVLLGVLLGWPAGMIAMRFYLPLYGPHFYRSIDEPGHIAAGVAMWRDGRFVILNDQPPLARLIFTAPLAAFTNTEVDNVHDRLVTIDPVKGNFVQAEIAIQEKHDDQVEAFYQKALAANPKSYDALVQLGGFYLGEKHRDYGKSDKYLHDALQVDAGRSGAYSALAQSLVLREKWTELDQVLAQAEKACPEDFSYYYQAARVLLNTGKDNERAERYFRKYLTQEPEVGRPSWAHAHWRLGLIFEKQGKKDQARLEIEIALKLNPELKAAEKDLKRVKG